MQQTAFYIILFGIPISMAVYKLSRCSEDGSYPVVTRMLQKYSDLHQSWADRNDLHTRMVEQAAVDKHLFTSARGNGAIHVRFNEYVLDVVNTNYH